MTVPYAFSAATSAIPLSQLDANFNTTITLGNTAIQLGNTVTTLNNMTLANVTISSGNVTLTNVTVTTANVTTANITTAVIGTANVTTANVATSIVTTSETLSYGTVNGVAYLNGSKVLTTGSVLTFDGTNLGLSGGNPAFIGNSSSTAFYIDNRTTGKVITFRVSNAAQADTEAMTIASASGGIGAVGIGYTSLTSVGNNGLAVLGNVGIGTSSPQSKIQVNPTGAYGIGTISNAGLHISPTNITGGFATGSVIWTNYALGGTSVAAYISAATYGNNYMDFSASGAATQMRLDSSGNLGIGTILPACKLNVDGNFILVQQSGSNNAYFGNSADLISGAPAGVAIRFNNTALRIAYSSTQIAMFDSSGNLGLGVTPSAWSGFSAVLQQRGGGHVVGDTGAFMQIGANNYYNGSNWIYTTTAPASRFTQNNGIFQWFNAASGTAGNAITFTQAMTMDASGNLLLGRTSQWSNEQFAISGSSSTQRFSYFRSTAAGHYLSLGTNGTLPYVEFGNGAGLAFNDGATERARITAAGSFVAGGSVALATNATDGFLYVPTCAGTPTGTPTAITGMAPIVVNTTNNKLYFYSGGAWRDAGP